MQTYSQKRQGMKRDPQQQYERAIAEAAKGDPLLAEKLRTDPHVALKKLGVSVPEGRRIHLVDEAAGDLVLRIPTPLSNAAQRKVGPAPQAGAWTVAISPVVHHFTGSIWPVGYKGDDRLDFTVPDGSTILGIELNADETASYGSRLESRPDNGAGPGSYSVLVHWWINAYQETYYNLHVRLTNNPQGSGGDQLGGRYEISGFTHDSTDWQPVSPDPAYGREDQIIFTHLW